MLEDNTPPKKTRKVQECLSRLGDRLHREISLSVHDVVVTEKHLARSIRKLVHYSSTSDIDRIACDNIEKNEMLERERLDPDEKGTSSDNEVVCKKKIPSLIIENVDEILPKNASDSEHVHDEVLHHDSNIFMKLKETSNRVHRISGAARAYDTSGALDVEHKQGVSDIIDHTYFQKNTRISDVNRRLKSQIWSSVVTIVLVEGRNLLACDPETGTSDPYVKFRLGNEKYKSKVIWRSLSPRWLEQFDLHLYDDGEQQLEVTVWDKDRSRDDFIGRCVIDLSGLEREKTHSFWQQLEEGAGSLNLLLTISGTTASETISDLTTYEENSRERANLLARYAWQHTFHNINDIGHLSVKVFRATGLAAADIGGKSDPFCVVELGNARLQTQTEYKTLTPSWQKIFTFNIKDINNVLEITVFDEDRDHKVEFLGKVAIPLLRIRSGEKRWYALKDKKLRSRAKGNSPQILLEMNVIWNPIRGVIRTLNPKEVKYMQPEVKFKRQVFVQNVLRLKVIIMHFYEFGKVVQSCFEWESTFQSFIGLMFWLILCYYFQPWMVPAAGLLFFFKQYIVRSLAGPAVVPWDEVADSDLDDDEDDDKDKEEKKSLKERLQAIQEVTQSVQNTIGKLATLGESVKNTFNFTVPYLSWIAIGLLVGTGLVLYFVPIRYLLMLWGTNKFARRIFRPHCVPNNELLDLLSRVPDDEMLLDYRDLKPSICTDPDRRREVRKKQKIS